MQLIALEDEDSSFCKILGWSSVTGAGQSSNLQVDVQCYHEDGNLEDLSFYLFVTGTP